MKKILEIIVLTVVLACIFNNNSYGQGWEKELQGDESNVISVCIDHNKDIVTISYSLTGGSDSIYFTKYNVNGNLKTKKRISLSGISQGCTRKIVPSPYKDGYLLFGISNCSSGGNNPKYIIKLDYNGNLVDSALNAFYNVNAGFEEFYHLSTQDDSIRVIDLCDNASNYCGRYTVKVFDKNLNNTSNYNGQINLSHIHVNGQIKLFPMTKLDDGSNILLYQDNSTGGYPISSTYRMCKISKEGKFEWLSGEVGKSYTEGWSGDFFSAGRDKNSNIYSIISEFDTTVGTPSSRSRIVLHFAKIFSDGRFSLSFSDTLPSEMGIFNWSNMIYSDNNNNMIISLGDYYYNHNYIYKRGSNVLEYIGTDTSSILCKSEIEFASLVYAKRVGQKQYLVKIDTIADTRLNLLKGYVYTELNNNCIKDGHEQDIPGVTLSVIGNNDTLFNTTDNNGEYFFKLDSGQFQIRMYSNVNYPDWHESICSPPAIINVNFSDTISKLFSLKPDIFCSFNTVNITVNSLHRCAVPGAHQGEFNVYTINYCNKGTSTSYNTYVDVVLNGLLKVDSASYPYTTMSNNVYRFNIGTLSYLTCGSFTITATPICDSTILGQTLCVEAHIYPDTVCTAQSYTGAIITSDAQCLGDSVRFHLHNVGIGNMPQPKRYIVIEDNVLRISHNYQLNAGQVLTETVHADTGKTYRIVAEEPDSFPAELGDPYTTAAVENCQPVHNNFSTGYFTQYPNYDGEPYRAMSCNVITGSYDPNEKIASPVGYGIQHYIEANTQIDYQINFQNTGNDTAFKVVVVDTISPALDINSIQLGVGSHNYQFQRTDSNVVQFVFDSIYLVDSFRNESLSHGFVKFKIQQKANNPDGTKIYNKADIYFDYNLPITTNQTFHTVGKDFIQVDLISEVKNVKYNVKEVKVFPNPFRDKTQVIVTSDPLKDPVLLLMNLQGSILKTIPSTGANTFDIYREDLATGMYIFKIIQAKETIATGKLVVQ